MKVRLSDAQLDKLRDLALELGAVTVNGEPVLAEAIRRLIDRAESPEATARKRAGDSEGPSETKAERPEA